MGYKRLFYMNITYECNNKCIFCISHNTKNKNMLMSESLLALKAADRIYNICNEDFFIINGGEPTICTEFTDIIYFLFQKQCKIIVYTNGRNLSKDHIRKLFNNFNAKWIVPFYGLENTHDFFTGQKNSFIETYQSILDMPNIFSNNISIKFLIKNEKQLDDIEMLFNVLKSKYNDFHFSLILNNNIEERIRITSKLSIITQNLNTNDINLKLSNIPLCMLPNLLLEKIISYSTNISTLNIDKYYFIKQDSVHLINYDKNHEWMESCKSCTLRFLCVDTSIKYRVLHISKNKIYLGEE